MREDLGGWTRTLGAAALLALHSVSWAASIQYDEAPVTETYERLLSDARTYRETVDRLLASQVARLNTPSVRRKINTAEFGVHWRDRERSRQQAAAPYVDTLRVSLLLAADTTSSRLRGQALQSAQFIAGPDWRGNSSRYRGARLAILEARGEGWTEREYDTAYQNMKALLLRMRRSGEVSRQLDDLMMRVLHPRSSRWRTISRGSGGGLLTGRVRVADPERTMGNAAAAELFDYTGHHDLALAFWWRALASHHEERQEAMRLFLVPDDSGEMDVLLFPGGLVIGRVKGADTAVQIRVGTWHMLPTDDHPAVARSLPPVGKMVDFVEAACEPSEISPVFRRVRREWSGLVAGLQEVMWGRAAPGQVSFSGGGSRAARDGLEAAIILAGLSRNLLARGHPQSSADLARKCLALCEAGKMRAYQEGCIAAGGLAIFPNQVYRTATQALQTLGQLDLDALLKSAGRDFPCRSRLDGPARKRLARSRRRFLEAYRLAAVSGGWPDAVQSAYSLVCLDVLERTADTPDAATYGELLAELRSDVLAVHEPSVRFSGDARPPSDVPMRLGVMTDLRLREEAAILGARLAALAGDPAAAQEYARAAESKWRAIWGGAGGELFKFSLADTRTPLYEGLIETLCEAGFHDDALAWSERVRSRATLEIISSRRRKRWATDRRAEQAIAAGAEALEQLRGALGARREGGVLAALRVPIAAKGAGRTNVSSAEDVRKALPQGSCMISYYLFRDHGVAWVVTPGKAVGVPLAAGREETAGLVRKWRTRLGTHRARGVGGITGDRRPPPEVNLHGDVTTRRLYELLVAPVEPHAGDCAHWCIVPHAALKYLSFAALSDGKRLLLDRHTVSYAWSLSTWQQVLALDRPKRLRRIVCLGNPDTGRPEHALPAAEAEARAVAALFADSDVFTGRDAHFDHLVRHAGDADVLHLACHSLPARGHGDRALALSPAGEHDGLVSFDELYSLETRAFLACLSACSSGLGQEMAGDEFLGFTRGFLAAGVPSLAISLWDVPDRSTAELMTEFYRRMPGQDLASALRGAQQAIARKHRSPWHWAAFTVYGVWAPETLTETSGRVRDLMRELEVGSDDRVAAARELAGIGPDAAKAVPGLMTALTDRRVDGLRDAAAAALVAIGPASAGPLIGALGAHRREVREAAADSLRRLGPQAHAALSAALTAENSRVMNLIKSMGAEAAWAVPSLVKMLSLPKPVSRRRAAEVLQAIGPAAQAAEAELKRVWTSDKDTFTRRAAFCAWSFVTSPNEVAGLLKQVDGDDEYVRKKAIEALGRKGREAIPAIPVLIGLLGDTDAYVRLQSVIALGRTGPAARAALPRLRELAAADPRSRMSREAAGAIALIEGKAPPSPRGRSRRPVRRRR